jgi:hypothetical protein
LVLVALGLEMLLYFSDDKKESQSVETNDTVKEEKTYRSYTKAQARQRFKKGKS